MRYRGGGVGHRILWPLRDIMLAAGHTRPKHQPQASHKGKERMEEPNELEEPEEGDVLDQVIAYDDDIVGGSDENDREAVQAIEDEVEDYMYGENEGEDEADEEEMELFDIFDP